MDDFDVSVDCLFLNLLDSGEYDAALEFLSLLHKHCLISESDFKQYVARVVVHFF